MMVTLIVPIGNADVAIKILPEIFSRDPDRLFRLVTPFDPSPDGQRFLFTPPKVPATPFTIILNWTANREIK